MPQHKSCKKRMRGSQKQNAYNRSVKSTVRTVTKKFLTAEGEKLEETFRVVVSNLDRAAKKGVIPKKRASRKKSRLARAKNKRAAA